MQPVAAKGLQALVVHRAARQLGAVDVLACERYTKIWAQTTLVRLQQVKTL